MTRKQVAAVEARVGRRAGATRRVVVRVNGVLESPLLPGDEVLDIQVVESPLTARQRRGEPWNMEAQVDVGMENFLRELRELEETKHEQGK